MLPLSEACERNKEPIVRVLKSEFAAVNRVLEIGSGTGQHAVHFARHLTHVTWLPSEVPAGLPGLQARLDAEAPRNVLPAIALEVHATPWPVEAVDGIFSANTLHIMAWNGVTAFFRGVGAVLAPGGVLCVYGPFRYKGEYTSPSNGEFDQWLKLRDRSSGIRDFEAVNELARLQGLELLADHVMPANNQTLVWRRTLTP